MKKINETFHPIDMTAWERQPYFLLFYENAAHRLFHDRRDGHYRDL